MGLPKVSINVEKGGLGRTQDLADGVVGIICSATADSTNVVLGRVMEVTSLRDAESKGTTISESGSNALMYSIIRDYYSFPGVHKTLYILPVGDSVTMAQMLDVSHATKGVSKLMEASGGRIRIIGVSKKNETAEIANKKVKTTVKTALEKGKASVIYHAAKMQPFRFVIDGGTPSTNVNANHDDTLKTSAEAGAVFLGNKDATKFNAQLGLIMGALSATPVHQKISWVNAGSLPISGTYHIGTKTVEAFTSENGDDYHDNNIIFLRSVPGKSGYYFSGDSTCADADSDYGSLAHGRVIDKAILVAYGVYVNHLNENVALTDKGKILPNLITSYEVEIETAITNNMGNAISSVRAVIDPDQNILSSDKLMVTLRIVPVGYMEEIEVSLGFENPNN